ncbi:hypothetical protein [Thiomicrorhabdus chilensis]|uniref:hypothetical protein n=1 Tax=Thiomicrorhabdus chilensis TaxID=63656 RepID=UPI000426DD82|nr:hypothetical protein [Thiomicrorhabdus chilensis]
MSKKSIIKLITFAVLFILLLWSVAWVLGLFGLMPTGDADKPLSIAFSSFDVLFAGLAFGGIIITTYMQISELEESREDHKKTIESTVQIAKTNEKLAQRADEKYVLDLFQTYCSDYFQKVKNDSQKVLFSCIGSRPYCNFVVSRLFAAYPLDFPDQSLPKLRQIQGLNEQQANDEKIKQIDQRCRYKFDELINFFTLLTSAGNTKEIISRCDFSYAFWRPYFWMIAIEQHNRYENTPEMKPYVTKPYFKEVVIKLDEIYGFTPLTNDEDVWDFIKNHPKISPFIDENF